MLTFHPPTSQRHPARLRDCSSDESIQCSSGPPVARSNAPMPGQRETHSRASSFSSVASSVATNESQKNAALLGAAAAFGRPRPKNAGATREETRHRSALAAAVNTGARSKTPSPDHGLRKARGPAPPPARADGVAAAGGRAQARGQPLLTLPAEAQQQRPKSPSFHAAQLAAARSPEPGGFTAPIAAPARKPQKPLVAPKPRRLSQNTEHAADSPLPSTTSLVKLFERKTSGPEHTRRPGPLAIRPSQDLAVRSPKPMRTPDGGITSVFEMELDTPRATQKKAQREARYHGKSSSDEYVSASEDTADGTPLTIQRTRSRSQSASPSRSSKSNFSRDAKPERKPHTSNDASVAQTIRPRPSPHVPAKPMSIQQGPPRAITSPPVSFTPSSASTQSLAAQWHQLYPRRATPLHTGGDLANAIVASSLASSRAPSPHKAKLEPPPVPSRRRHHAFGFSRTPSPAKHGMRYTLRKQESDGSGAEAELHPYGKHRKKRLVRKHPNKHHEGDRKRWRDAVTERERKRYEGVWAANKGIHCTLTSAEQERISVEPDAEVAQAAQAAISDQVSNIVVRDIWSRSRLSAHALEMVWDLVDNQGVGRLGKVEFVVGMWLVDQRLKGRKLPVKVSESVWASVRSVQGIKIRK